MYICNKTRLKHLVIMTEMSSSSCSCYYTN